MNDTYNRTLSARTCSYDASSCNTRCADEVWASEYRYIPMGSLPRFWLRDTATGKCLVLDDSRDPETFVYTCSDDQDQHWKAGT